MDRRSGVVVMLGAVAAYTLADGFVHLREWLDGYSRIPTVIPGWWVVRVGFIANAVMSVVVALGLWVAVRRPRLVRRAIGAALLFNGGSLAVLVATRTSSVFGWSEHVWTDGANQARALAIGAVVLSVIALVAERFATRRIPPLRTPRPHRA